MIEPAEAQADSSARDGGSVSDIANRLVLYLRALTGKEAIAFADALTSIPGGTEAAIFAFRLANAPDAMSGPLVLRLLPPSAPSEAIRREAAIQNALGRLGYPTPRTVMIEMDPSHLGGPFLIMERREGEMLGHSLELLGAGGLAAPFGLPSRLRRIGRLWAEAQVSLHALPSKAVEDALRIEGFTADEFSFDLQLARTTELIARTEWEGLRGVLAWLEGNKPPAGPSVLCHGDLHPYNIMVADERLTGVLDWSNAVIGAPELDLGAALVLVDTVPLDAPAPVRPILRSVMRSLGGNLVRLYRRVRPLDAAMLRYFQVYHCLRHLAVVGLDAASGDPKASTYGSAGGVRALTARIRSIAAVDVKLEIDWTSGA